jgi:type IV secretory pathway VirD2 relaxase
VTRYFGQDARMSVREAISARLNIAESPEDADRIARLPYRLKRDSGGVRLGMMQRLSASRLFAYGDRAGVLRSAQKRSGRAFRLDVRQRVIVKALVSRHMGRGVARGAALAAHMAYLGRTGAGLEGARPDFFDARSDAADPTAATAGWAADRHHFRFIISPEHGDRLADLRGYTREVMNRVAGDLGQPDLQWVATCHFDTDQPHAHVLVRGRKPNGKDLVIPRHYISVGFRMRAQEVAQERLGDLSRADAERRIWRETQADRFTGFDRRLLQAADRDGMVDDGVGGSDAWSALTRGRLRHLEALGLARRNGHRYRLDSDLERQLRSLQLRRDIIRTLYLRRLESGREVRELDAEAVRGRVVRAGRHDELSASGWVIVRDGSGAEHYARLKFGQTPPTLGRSVELVPTPQGALVRSLGRSSDLAR